MHKSVVEMETSVCENIKQAREENVFSPKKSGRFSQKHNLRVSGGGNSPFSDWKLQNITTKDRYDIIVNDMRCSSF